MPKTVLPEPLTECPACGGSITDIGNGIVCEQCDDWKRMVVPDAEDALRPHPLNEIVSHARRHQRECLCAACRYARENAATYL